MCDLGQLLLSREMGCRQDMFRNLESSELGDRMELEDDGWSHTGSLTVLSCKTRGSGCCS